MCSPLMLRRPAPLGKIAREKYESTMRRLSSFDDTSRKHSVSDAEISAILNNLSTQGKKKTWEIEGEKKHRKNIFR